MGEGGTQTHWGKIRLTTQGKIDKIKGMIMEHQRLIAEGKPLNNYESIMTAVYIRDPDRVTFHKQHYSRRRKSYGKHDNRPKRKEQLPEFQRKAKNKYNADSS